MIRDTNTKSRSRILNQREPLDLDACLGTWLGGAVLAQSLPFVSPCFIFLPSLDLLS
jgi:hypothetical protein